MRNSIDSIPEQIVSRLQLNHCHALMNKTDYELMFNKGVKREVDSILLEKQRMPVRIWVEFIGSLKLLHYTTGENANEIASKGFDKSKYSPANFNPNLTGLYCVRADCPHGLTALTIVRSDYPSIHIRLNLYILGTIILQ